MQSIHNIYIPWNLVEIEPSSHAKTFVMGSQESQKQQQSSKQLSRFLEFMQLPQTRDLRDSSENLKHQEQEVAEN